jgi:hypothetical protein
MTFPTPEERAHNPECYCNEYPNLTCPNCDFAADCVDEDRRAIVEKGGALDQAIAKYREDCPEPRWPTCACLRKALAEILGVSDADA